MSDKIDLKKLEKVSGAGDIISNNYFKCPIAAVRTTVHNHASSVHARPLRPVYAKTAADLGTIPMNPAPRTITTFKQKEDSSYVIL